MKFYNRVTTIYSNGKRIFYRSQNYLTEKEMQNISTTITWNNINDIRQYAASDIRTYKKGRRLWVSGGLDFDGFYFKEWKKPNLALEVKREYTEISPSINTILDWPDGEAAMKYLLERGINIVGK